MKIDILYRTLLDSMGQRFLTGGVETYILALGKLCNELGFDTSVYQLADTQFDVERDSIRVIGVPAEHTSPARQVARLIVAANERRTVGRRILIFGADHFSVRMRDPRSILIQHGISWDLPRIRQDGGGTEAGAVLKQARVFWLAKRAFENTSNRVCVDYNFLSWYRTVAVRGVTERTWVIPNFTRVLDWATINRNRPTDGTVSILFARRFTDYRGTRLLAWVMKRMLPELENIRFTLAGEGPDEDWLRRQFEGEERVAFTRYTPDQTMDVHSRHHIAVVPSLGSEGTALSVAEALGAGCAVVATNVGGITNMILDGYNGLLVMPTEEALLEALMTVIDDDGLRLRLALRGWETACSAFSIERWKKQWGQVLDEVAGREQCAG